MLDLLFPPICAGCKCLVPPSRGLPLCSQCRPEHQPLPLPSPTRDGALLSYEGPARAALKRLKYDGDPAWAGPLGAELARAPHLSAGFDLVIPVPLHRRRRWRRGFNQTALLLRAAKARVASRILVRTRNTPAQADMPASARWKNVAGAFAVRPSARRNIAGARILLVDDVVTTKATLQAARAPLVDAGAHVVTLALLQALP